MPKTYYYPKEYTYYSSDKAPTKDKIDTPSKRIPGDIITIIQTTIYSLPIANYSSNIIDLATPINSTPPSLGANTASTYSTPAIKEHYVPGHMDIAQSGSKPKYKNNPGGLYDTYGNISIIFVLENGAPKTVVIGNISPLEKVLEEYFGSGNRPARNDGKDNTIKGRYMPKDAWKYLPNDGATLTSYKPVLTSDNKSYFDLMKYLEETHNDVTEYVDWIGGGDGYIILGQYDPSNDKVKVLKNLPPHKMLRTLLHEWEHRERHYKGMSQNEAEVEAAVDEKLRNGSYN